MPSPPAAESAAAAGDNHQAMFGDEVEDDDSDSEMEMDEDSEDFDEEHPAVAAPEEDLNSSPSSSTDDDERVENPNSNTNPSNGKNNNATTTINPPSQQPSVPVSASPLSSVAPASASDVFETPEAKRQKLDGAILVTEERKTSAASLEDSRRLFQRLWTDEDEIAILQGFYEFTSQRGTTHHAHQHDTGPFYDQIRTKLQLDFNKNQLVEKLRRLKKKYRNVINRMASGKDFAFKSPHDQATFEISRKIWSNSVARGGAYDQDDDDANDGDHAFEKKARRRGRKRSVAIATAAAVATAGSEAVAVEVKAVPTLTTTSCAAVPTTASTSVATQNIVEETMRSCLSPLFKEMLHCAMGGPLAASMGGGSPLALSMMPLNFLSSSGIPKEGDVGEKWRKQQILELEVYSKRLELVQEQIKATLDELRSSG